VPLSTRNTPGSNDASADGEVMPGATATATSAEPDHSQPSHPRRRTLWPIRVSNLTHPPPFVGSRLVEIGGRRIVLVRFGSLRPRFRSSFGIHLKRLQDALYLARSLDSSLYVLWYRAAPNQAVHRLSSADVRIIRSSRARNAFFMSLWLATSPLAALQRSLYPIVERLRRRLRKLEKAHATRNKRDRAAASGVRKRPQPTPMERLVRLACFSLAWTEPTENHRNKNLRREMVHSPIRVQLPSALEKVARAQAAQLGLDHNSRIVTLHVREPGWRRLEDDPRSCDIATYRPAVDELVARSFHVIRIGDASMTPIDWPGVIDLATGAARTDLLELWCMLQSVFFLGSESGPLELAKLIGVPTLLVNVKTIQSGYPLHRSDLFILKRLLSPDERRVLSLREQLAVKAGQLDLGGSPRYFDNSPEEILAAVVEMLHGRQAVAPESPEQAEFRRLASMKVVEGKSHQRYLGEGRLASFFAHRHLNRSEPLRAAGAMDDGAAAAPQSSPP
jgi:putative glycosyltransferase (TIGR04372 family)